jgi:ubiquinone/menaquinone biosynthesis C-methylase UbiE
MSCSDEIFIKEAYSENASLKVFLDSLSYHKVGAAFFSTQIARLNLPKDWNLLDIGCGDGQFTYELLRKLEQKHLAPANITAIDPDVNNLMSYEQQLHEYRDIQVRAHRGVVEALPVGQWFIVLLSHSLYQFMENPHISDITKNRVLGELPKMVTKNGGLLISMAK